MNIRALAFGLASLFLAGCTEQDWNHALTYVGVNDRPETAASSPAPQKATTARPAAQAARTAPASPAPVQEAQTPKLNRFCESVAQQDSQSNDFDAPTQQRVFIRSYQQCVAIFGDATQ